MTTAAVTLIQPDAVLAALDNLALGSPGRRAGDSYVRNGKPHCIVAHALDRLGVPVTDLAALDALSALISDEAASFVPLAPAARSILAAAQRTQDDGQPWIKAFRAAVTEARRLGVLA